MSKTRGNYYTFRDLRGRGFDPAAIRYLLLSVPYRKQLNFTFEGLRGAEKTVESLRDFRARVKATRCEPGSNSIFRGRIKRALDEFEAGMDDDLNTSVALAAIHDLKREVNTEIDRHDLKEDERRYVLEFIEKVNSVLNVFPEDEPALLDEDIQRLIDERQQARHRRDFARADEIRDQLAARGITLEDTRDGVRWKRR